MDLPAWTLLLPVAATAAAGVIGAWWQGRAQLQRVVQERAAPAPAPERALVLPPPREPAPSLPAMCSPCSEEDRITAIADRTARAEARVDELDKRVRELEIEIAADIRELKTLARAKAARAHGGRDDRGSDG